MYQSPCQSKQVTTLLCHAEASRHINVVNVLLEFGVSVDMTDYCQLTPLMAWCEQALEVLNKTSYKQLHSTKASIIISFKRCQLESQNSMLWYDSTYVRSTFLLNLLIK